MTDLSLVFWATANAIYRNKRRFKNVSFDERASQAQTNIELLQRSPELYSGQNTRISPIKTSDAVMPWMRQRVLSDFSPCLTGIREKLLYVRAQLLHASVL